VEALSLNSSYNNVQSSKLHSVEINYALRSS